MCTDILGKTVVLAFWVSGSLKSMDSRKPTPCLGVAGVQGEWSGMGLALLRWALAGMGVEVGRFRRLGQSSPWV